MAETATRYLYLVRHGEAQAVAAPGGGGNGGGLTEAGRRQAVLLGRRLRGSAVSVAHHGPLPRAAQTARLIAEQLHDVTLHETDVAGDFVPYVPERDELPHDSADFLLRFLEGFSAEERTRGPVLAARAVERFTGPVAGARERHELVVTHNFLIGWLVRHATDAPQWRWLGFNHGNAALTVIRYAPGRPSSVLVYNDMRHLPDDLRWTGFPPELRM
ncbi:histidine phosphatase family protein [Streptacidiphilus sp. PB12-B1b]|uniref:histidine phosphatase family protein n=1 Tax=Streptacidiphilus sp. PB12-B1b TaxID=2705012 RepID=UPI0015F9FB21|nr:histidine phosphatase family protein [Streptacidiphilus sp. PB12-B1b]QMU77468.1 histidine phosphatase family protein [Streptacidiphilus sp. PB12-B1b]